MRFTTLSLSSLLFTSASAFMGTARHQNKKSFFALDGVSQLQQLSEMTTLSIDSGDLNLIRKWATTGCITDATTNPLFVSQAGLSGDATYAAMVDDAVAVAKAQGFTNEDDTVSYAIDRLAVNLGAAISEIVTGYISTEVDPRLSFNTEASLTRARRIIKMYEEKGVPKERILIKLAATWEGIKACEVLEKEGVRCNLTLIFSTIQGIACGQYGAHLISPFPGRILDWHKNKLGRTQGVAPDKDEGVIVVKQMYNYFRAHGHDTICMPASWRPSRGEGYELDEIRELAGTDRMTIPPPLLEKLQACEDPLPQILSIQSGKSSGEPLIGGGKISEVEFRDILNADECGVAKMAEGLNAFIMETEKLQEVITAKVRSSS